MMMMMISHATLIECSAASKGDATISAMLHRSPNQQERNMLEIKLGWWVLGVSDMILIAEPPPSHNTGHMYHIQAIIKIY